MLIQLLSDLHNEFLRNGRSSTGHQWAGSIPVTDADVIVLAGDIDTGVSGIDWAIDESQRLGKPVIYVFGNHEFYHQEYFRLLAEAAGLCKNTNVKLLSEGTFEINKVRFIGATLWTDYEIGSGSQEEAMYCASQRLADHRLISYKTASTYENFTPQQALLIHKQELSWIEKQLELPFDGKTIVVTHHGPHLVCQHPAFSINELSAAFYSDLAWLVAKNNIDVWMYGHSHANLDVMINDTRIISNQAGYPGENVRGFDVNLLIEI